MVPLLCGCTCSERDSAFPFRAVRSTGSRCICFSLQILRDLLCVSCCRLGGGAPPGPLPLSLRYRPLSSFLAAAAGPAPETGGGTEEVPKAGPGGGPPSDPEGWVGSAAQWPPRRRVNGMRERATEATRRRPISRRPARPIPAIRTIGSGPAQNSPVCTLVTSGTRPGRRGGRGGRRSGRGRGRRGGRGGHGRRRDRGAPGHADVADVEADAAHGR